MTDFRTDKRLNTTEHTAERWTHGGVKLEVGADAMKADHTSSAAPQRRPGRHGHHGHRRLGDAGMGN